MKQKVGVQVGKSRKQNKPVIANASSNEFVSVVDGVTFGILSKHTFHSGRRDWSFEDRIQWAKANARFFVVLASNLENWAEAVQAEWGEK